MQFPAPLIKGTLVRRYKRFLADITLDDGREVTAHCANPGAMIGLKEPGAEVWLSPAVNPERKLKYSWELLRVGDGLVGINTILPNAIAEEAILGNNVPELGGYANLRREVKYGQSSRIDILLEDTARPPCYVEVKNVHLKRNGPAEFPDSVTTRGAKHLVELGDMVEAGNRAVMFYVVQREDCIRFQIADDIDTNYAAGLKVAIGRGVEILCYRCKLSTQSIVLDRPMQFVRPE